jgi:phosphohistidine swiveling domain-containing protein
MTPQTMTTTGARAPFSFADPADEALFWQHDAMHFPDPLAPMEAAMLERTLGQGFGYGAAAYNAPIDRVEVRTIEGYQYQSMVPMTGTPEEMAAQGALAEASIRAALADLGSLWEDTVLPEVREHLGFWDTFDLEGATRAAFAEHVEQTWAHLRRLWELHFVIVLPCYLAMSEFDELYRGLFEDAGPLDSYRLLEGRPNLTVEVGQALWELSRAALASDEVRDVLLSQPAADVPAALARSEHGRGFLADLHAYLDVYGRRADKWTLLAPSWTEDPTPVIESLRDFVGRPDSQAPAVTTQAAAAAAQSAIDAARERLRDYPAPVVGQFEAMLAAAQAALVISEDHNFYIDNMSIHHLRAVLMEAGRRLAAEGSIRAVEDVFLLSPEELAAALATPGAELRWLVAGRAAEMERRRALVPPPVLGAIPTEPPPDDPFTRLAMKFNGVPQAPSAGGELRGSPGSAGTVRGRARVIHSISEAGRIEPGDILVAETTAPPWTPLFAIVGAVVTDTGGVLSHCAVVAREYGIPAVVGTGIASTVITDGQMLEIDGDAGTVRFI